MSTPKKEYILGTGSDELVRLGLQHRIWADASVASWKRAGIGVGSRVLDVGSGPGYISMDLAQLVTEKGQVTAIDESPGFVEYLNDKAQALILPQLRARQGDAQNLKATLDPSDLYDAIYCRWVLCWLKDPASAIAGMKAQLKPGGKLIIHDYFNWKCMAAAPRSVAIEKMVLAGIQSFQERNGNVDIAADLPALFRKNGLTLSHFEVYQRAARGGGTDSTLDWVLTWWRTYGPKLVVLGKLSAEDFDQAARDLDLLERDPDRFFHCPPVYEFIGTRESL